jgi:hypothetical protein
MKSITRDFVKGMNLEEHQYIAYTHHDKDHQHIHLYVNRINSVNIAARLQDATKKLNNSLVVSAQVFHLLDQLPTVTYSTSIALKGINCPLHVYLLGKPYSFTHAKANVQSTIG